MNTSLKNTKYLATLGIFIAIIIVMGITPNLGFVSLTPALSIVLLHIPVIIGAVILGPKAGGILGLFFGLMSVYKGFVVPSAGDLFVMNLFFSKGNFMGIINLFIVLIVPRVLIGIVAGYVHKLFSNKLNIVSKIAAGIAGTLTNSVIFLGILLLLFGNALVGDDPSKVLSAWLGGIIASNALIEVGLAAILTPALTIPLLKAIKQKG